VGRRALAEVQLGLWVGATAEMPREVAGDAMRRALLVEPDVREVSAASSSPLSMPLWLRLLAEHGEALLETTLGISEMIPVALGSTHRHKSGEQA
jgi:hypothetical protein